MRALTGLPAVCLGSLIAGWADMAWGQNARVGIEVLAGDGRGVRPTATAFPASAPGISPPTLDGVKLPDLTPSLQAAVFPGVAQPQAAVQLDGTHLQPLRDQMAGLNASREQPSAGHAGLSAAALGATIWDGARADASLGRGPFFEPVAAGLSREELVAAHVFDPARLGSGPRALAEARYLVELKDRAVRLHRTFFPQFYREFPLTLDFRSSRGSSRRGRSAVHRRSADGAHEIWFEDDDSTHAEDGEAVRPFVVTDAPVARKIDMTVAMFHEYAHGIFAEVVESRREGNPWAGEKAALKALDEGFAVFLELLVIDKMAAARVELGLSEAEVSDLRARKRARLAALRRNRNYYAEGTFLWHRLYKREGEAGLSRVLEDFETLTGLQGKKSRH